MCIQASDGVLLRGVLTYPGGRPGTVSPLAVLAHQYPATRDSFAPLAADLLSLGFAVLAFDLRGHGESTVSPSGPLVIDAPAGVTMQDFGAGFVSSISKVAFARIADDIVRAAGWGVSQNFVDATRVLLAGASVGGTGVLLAAPRLAGALMGVVTLGAAGALAHGESAPATIRQNCVNSPVPLLLTSSEGDPFEGAKNVREWSAGTTNARAVVVPGEAHAMAIYFDVRDEVLAFVRALWSDEGRAERRGPER
jgi:dienelactone hydrolase